MKEMMSTNKVFLIGEQSLKDFNINDNLDANYLNPAIHTAQEIYLQQIIGTKLLEKIKDMIANNSLTDDYKLLLDDYITPYLQFKVSAELVIPIAYKTRNAGVVVTNNEYVTNTQMKDATYLKNHYEDRADFYSIRLSKYLNANRGKYPEYRQSSVCKGDVTASSTFESNIYLD